MTSLVSLLVNNNVEVVSQIKYLFIHGQLLSMTYLFSASGEQKLQR